MTASTLPTVGVKSAAAAHQPHDGRRALPAPPSGRAMSSSAARYSGEPGPGKIAIEVPAGKGLARGVGVRVTGARGFAVHRHLALARPIGCPRPRRRPEPTLVTLSPARPAPRSDPRHRETRRTPIARTRGPPGRCRTPRASSRASRMPESARSVSKRSRNPSGFASRSASNPRAKSMPKAYGKL